MEQSESILYKIMDWIISGTPKSAIIDMIRDELLPGASKSHAEELIQRSKDLMAETVTMDTDQVIKSHLSVYEQIYKWAEDAGETALANKAMKAKERLLSLIQNSKVTVNNKKTININRNITYDINKLTPEEQIEFNQLLDIARIRKPESTETGQDS